ncbi:unnamed protein product [Urochloa humidicola]
MASPHRLPELTDDATEEILLRIRPDEPRDLVRASLVCDLWHRLIVDPAFLHRYREFHRMPPLLGFFQNSLTTVDRAHEPRFISTTSATPLPQLAFDFPKWQALSCCHGQVLVGDDRHYDLVVWDPISGHQHKLPEQRIPICIYNSFAQLQPPLIAAAACS